MPPFHLPQPPKRGKVSTLSELARALGVSRRTIDRLIADGLRPDADGRYDLETAWRFRLARAGRGQHYAAASPSATAWQARRLRALAMRAERELQEKLRSLVSIDEARREWRRNVNRITRMCRGLGRELAPRLVGKGPHEIQATIDERVMQLLRELADAGE